LNQKAREVPPTLKSLTSTGLYIMFSKKKVFFWIGSEFYQRYICDRKTGGEKSRKLISDGLFLRLLTIHRRDVLYLNDLDD